MPKNSHILNAASNLLGIALLIITGINITDRAQKTFADEMAWVAAIALATSCILSYLSIRTQKREGLFEDWADKVFLAGMFGLLAAAVILAFGRG